MVSVEEEWKKKSWVESRGKGGNVKVGSSVGGIVGHVRWLADFVSFLKGQLILFSQGSFLSAWQIALAPIITTPANGTWRKALGSRLFIFRSSKPGGGGGQVR